ncbi:MAG: cytochrome c [Geminicoccaceae bacterium]|nr:cytochrome c [Geminicoccaceae bacterium]
MSEVMTKSMARNIFYGGSAFFLLIFAGLVVQSHGYIRNTSTNAATLTDSVVAGKRIWEKKGCINCHTLLGEGAYYAPELGNVMKRWGVEKDPVAAKAALKAWMDAQPTGIKGRRQMPQFHLNDQEVGEMADFLMWTNTIRNQNWPPKDAG